MRFSCFPVLPGSAEAQVIWGGTLKRLLIAYCITNICAKKISKCVHVCQSYSKPKVGRFLRHSVLRTAKTPPRTLTQNASKDAVPRKDMPFSRSQN